MEVMNKSAPFEISIDYLRECLEYDPDTGILRWRRDRPAAHFPSEAYRKRWTSRYGGTKIKGRSHAYLTVTLKQDGVKRKFQAHRVIWAMVHGYWPYPTVDHRDGVGDNNRISNLMEATVGEQRQNALPSRTTAIARGVRPNGSGYMARIGVDGKLIYLGNFRTPEEANVAYLKAKSIMHPKNQGSAR